MTKKGLIFGILYPLVLLAPSFISAFSSVSSVGCGYGLESFCQTILVAAEVTPKMIKTITDDNMESCLLGNTEAQLKCQV